MGIDHLELGPQTDQAKAPSMRKTTCLKEGDGIMDDETGDSKDSPNRSREVDSNPFRNGEITESLILDIKSGNEGAWIKFDKFFRPWAQRLIKRLVDLQEKEIEEVTGRACTETRDRITKEPYVSIKRTEILAVKAIRCCTRAFEDDLNPFKNGEITESLILDIKSGNEGAWIKFDKFFRPWAQRLIKRRVDLQEKEIEEVTRCACSETRDEITSETRDEITSEMRDEITKEPSVSIKRTEKLAVKAVYRCTRAFQEQQPGYAQKQNIFVKSHYPWLKRVVARHGVPIHDTEDVVHEIFLTITSNGYDPSKITKTKICKIASHRSVDHLRKRKNTRTEPLEFPDDIPCQDDTEKKANSRQLIEKMLHWAAEQGFEEIVQARLDGLSTKETADKYGINLSKVKRIWVKTNAYLVQLASKEEKVQKVQSALQWADSKGYAPIIQARLNGLNAEETAKRCQIEPIDVKRIWSEFYSYLTTRV